MKRTLTALLISGSLVALPALAKQEGTKIRSNTNPAGSHTMVMTKSGNVMSKTMTNTEGNKVRTSSQVKSKRLKKSNVHLAKFRKGNRRGQRK